MFDFEEGYNYFVNNSSAYSGTINSKTYIDAINKEIDEMINNLNSMNGFQTSSQMLKGDVAEFWHSGTFNINSALNGSHHRTIVDRSHEFASADITTNFDQKYGLKYYNNGQASAKAQAISVFERFKEYQSKGGKDNLVEFLKNRGFGDEAVLNDPIYTGQIRIIPRDQLEEATRWLERTIQKESINRPEQVKRYQDTLSLLRDRISDNQGVESIPLSKQEAEQLANIAKQGKVNSSDLGLTTETLINYEHILKQSCKAGLTAATISLVLNVVPEIYKAIDYLIKSGEIEKEQIKKIGFAAISGSSEGFVRGSISAALTACCSSGMLGEVFKSVDPCIIGTITVITMNVIKNSFEVAIGRKQSRELATELIRDMYVSTCSLICGGISQSLIEIPIVGYMIGSFIGSIFGTFTYNIGYKTAVSFCIDTGFTLFGLVEQDYSLPTEIMKEIGLNVFEYETFEHDKFEPDVFSINTFEFETMQPESIEITFLRRGVIGVSKIGYI